MNNLDNQQAQDNQQSELNAANTLAGTEQQANNDVQAQQIANANPLQQGGTDQQQQQQSAAVNPVTYDFSKVELPEDYQLSEEESNMFKDVIKDKESKIYLYCRSGHRSGIALNAMKELGYTDLTNIGGIIHYKGELE